MKGGYGSKTFNKEIYTYSFTVKLDAKVQIIHTRAILGLTIFSAMAFNLDLNNKADVEGHT